MFVGIANVIGVRGAARPLAIILATAIWLAASPAALAQSTPVYPDDSVQARETLARVDELLNAGNLAESARVLQALLDAEGDKVLESKEDGDVFHSVREHVHKLLLSRPALLERYRASEGPRAAKLLEDGIIDQVERSRLLTSAGLEAALRLAQVQYESARFEAARQSLEQLEHHPDRTAGKPGAAAAAALAAKVSRFLSRDDVRRWASRWSSEAGLNEKAGGEIPLPPGLRIETSSPQTGGTAPDWGTLPEEPLVSSVLTGRSNRDTDDEEDAQIFEAARQSASKAWIMPLVTGDLAIVNNGTEINGLDRFTLSTLWTVRPGASARLDLRRESQRPGLPLSRLEDSAWVVANGSVGVAATGYATETGREGDRRLHAFDIASGRILWSVDPTSLDRRLEGCSVRGEPVVSEGTLVVPMRRNSSVRRVSGAILAGLDLWTGELKWVRPLCSVGVPPFSRAPRAAERCVSAEGVVYRCDGLGVVAAVEAASGRVIWVRRMNPPGDLRGLSAISLQTSHQPWSSTQPILDGLSVIMITPDGSAVVRLSAADGTLLGRRGAEEFGENATMPGYLVRSQDRLVVVTADRLVSMRIADFEKSPIAVSAPFRDVQMTGRVVSVGPRVLVPLDDQLAEVESADMKVVATHKLGKAGNVVPMSDGLLVADAMELHAFLRWETAEAILAKRIEASPDDAAPALSMANLAFRAGRYARIVPAVDRVLDIRDRSPDSAASQTVRRRLIDSLRNMFAAGKQKWDPAAESRALGPPAGAPSVQVLAELGQRFARAAESPAELAEQELTVGWLGEAKGAPAASIEAYGRIFSDESLAESEVLSDFGVPVRAADVATDRLLALIKRQGPEPYAGFAAQAARELEELGDHATAAELGSLGRRFPAAPAAASAWTRLADMEEKADRRAASARSLALALRALEYGQSARSPELALEARRIGARLVETLASLDRASEAVRVAEQIGRRFPGPAITVPSAARDRTMAVSRRPQFGDRIEGSVQALVGWTIALPKIADGVGRPTDRAVLTSTGRKQVGLFGSSLTDGRLAPMWIRGFEQRPPRVIRIDHDATYLYWPAESRTDRSGGVIERVRNDGTSAWLSREVATILDEIDVRSGDDAAAFATPLDGSVSPGDLLVAMDGSTLVLIERVGRIVAIDLESGKQLWTARLQSTHVYDGAISGGTLVVGGASTDRTENNIAARRMSLLPMTLVAFDARKGGPARDLRPALAKKLNPSEAKNISLALGDRQQVRWLRSIGAGRVLLGMIDRVLAVDAAGDTVLWMCDKPSVGRSLECWVLGDRAYVLNEDRGIVALSLADGSTPIGELDSKDRLQGDATVGAALLADGQVAFATSHGLAVFGRDGKLTGLDSGAIAGESSQHFAIGADRVAMVPEAWSDQDPTLDLRILSLPGGKLVSSRPIVVSRAPTELVAIDGRLLLTAGGVTLVLPAPVGNDAPVP